MYNLVQVQHLFPVFKNESVIVNIFIEVQLPSQQVVNASYL